MNDNSSERGEILGWLRSKDDRGRAFEALERLSAAQRSLRIDPSVATELARMLDDPSRTRQREVADLLRRWVASAPALEQALRTALAALEPRLRWGAAYTLGHALPSPPTELWPIVRETLALEDGDQRWAAAELACSLARAHRSVRDEILAAVDSGSASVRRMLLYCLRDLGDEDLAGVARRRLADEDPGVRLAALSAATRCPPGAPADLGDTWAIAGAAGQGIDEQTLEAMMGEVFDGEFDVIDSIPLRRARRSAARSCLARADHAPSRCDAHSAVATAPDPIRARPS